MEKDKRICLPGLSIANYFAMEKAFHRRIFSLAEGSLIAWRLSSIEKGSILENSFPGFSFK
jgi:hypothetical protein